ncbi:MAG: dihydrofolate reductase [Planctomycetes bacterium]|nr:dihydrofolate reductase [Planctomycetota bacterium]MBL7037721.1 dihydrofolate reductase [Pirellulaceae bacterium]
MRISLIVAMSENRVIGRDGRLPWHLSADLRRFKRLTMGHHIIMGRKTFESIGRLLPGRITVVVTRQADYEADEALVAHDIDEAIRAAKSDNEAFLIGGGELYRQALSAVDRIYLTQVHAQVEGDTLFPELQLGDWQIVEQSRHPADRQNQYEHSFLVYDRVSSTGRCTGRKGTLAG